MTMPDISLATDAATLSPVALFIQADIVVKIVMVGLLVASIWTWLIISAFYLRLRGVNRKSEAFEQDFWRTPDIDSFHREHAKSALPTARVMTAGVSEWRRSTKAKVVDRAAVRERLASAMQSATSGEIDSLSDRLNILATIGSVAPFVGLFGTVWGIMRSFTAIAAEQNSSLAVVAPGIAEALFATALGLFAAIPAVIAYNRFSHRIGRFEARLYRFADGFHATLSRELESDA